LEIVGDGPERTKLERLVADLGLEEKITFFGGLRGDALHDRYRLCNVFVMPSKTMKDDVEGFGTVFLEAGLAGKPSVGTRSGGIPEAILDGETGILVEEGDVQELASAIKRILADANLGLRLGVGARTRVLSEFTWEKSADCLKGMLRREGA
jgi:phosphatidylinositol alpha-1,6-mannosyltransferase